MLETFKILFTSQPIEEFLQNISRKKDPVFRADVRTKSPHVWVCLINLRPSKYQRPHRCINDEVQRSARSCL